ncbi:MAG TPA: helix-turn-helix domain-containing protein [Trueperaceae bacterium]
MRRDATDHDPGGQPCGWLDRQTRALAGRDQAVVLVGGSDWGVPFILDALSGRGGVAWVQLGPRDTADAVSQGNALAGALNRATRSRLFTQALPFRFHLHTLQRYRRELLPLTIAVSGAEYGRELAADLLELEGEGLHAVLDFTSLEQMPAGTLARGSRELALTPAEARCLAPRSLGDEAVARLHRQTGGRYTTFVETLRDRLGLPSLSLPGPTRSLLPAGAAEEVEPPQLVRALLLHEQHIEALEVAVMAAPELVEETLKTAGPAYQARGLMRRLHLLLSTLQEPHDRRERTLEWRLLAGHYANDYHHVLRLVDGHLGANPAPELRARRAALHSEDLAFEEAARAASSEATPLTLWQWGRLHPDTEQGIEILRNSVNLAEQRGDSYGVVRNAGALAERLSRAGRFQEAVGWNEWALQVLDRHEIRDGERRLRLFNNLAFGRILLGDTAGLRSSLKNMQEALAHIGATLADAYKSTLARLELSNKRSEWALRLTTELYEQTARHHRGRYALVHVLALLDNDDTAEARKVARQAVALTAGDHPNLQAPARVALGMVQAVAGNPAALTLLADLVENDRLPVEWRLTALLYKQLVDPHSLRDAPEDLRRALRDIPEAGLRALSGPEQALAPVWREVLGQEADLNLACLGRAEATLRGEELQLSTRLWEVLLALALHPAGMTDHELHAFLVGDSGYGLSTLRTHVSRLRSIVPISEMPYRITVPYTLDVDELRAHLRAGRVRQALNVAAGPMLPHSNASGIEAARAELDEELRQAVLAAADPEALYDLAEWSKDDLELWEATAQALPEGDPRLAIAAARARLLEADYRALRA